MSRPRPGAVLGRVLAALALTPVLALGAADRALAMGQDPAAVPTAVVPAPDEPDPPSEPDPEPEPEPEPVPTTAAPTTAAPQPTREATRTPDPVPTVTRTSLPSPIATLLEEVTSSPSPTSTTTRPPIPIGGLGDDEDPVDETAEDAAEDDGAPADALTRLVQLVVAGAVLLGVGGGVGLYLTREGR